MNSKSSAPPSRSEIKRQIQLPFRKAVEISIKSIRIRMGRSIITAGGILLGIAFFSSVRMSAMFADIQNEITKDRKARIQAGTLKPTEKDTKLIAASAVDAVEERGAANRLKWLSIMGLIVCTVGIANAMLMSVTERYKEIGTMKCLGALDSLIVKLFFIESCLLGLIASALGFVLGWLAVSVVNLVVLGLEAFGLPFWLGSVQLGLFAVAMGTALTFVATIAPAIRAAQMPPAAALRVEI